MLYDRIQLPDTLLSTGPLPPELEGLAPESLADLSAALDPCPAHLVGLAFFPAPPSAGEIAAMRAAKVSEVKAEARRRILARWPEWRQANMTARAVELLDTKAVTGALTTEEAAERVALIEAWAQIRAIRAASDAIEALIPDDAAGIAGFDVAAQDWPEPV